VLAPAAEREIFSAAVALLAARPRSEADLRRRLAERFGDAPRLDGCTAKLKDLGYINDAKLAEDYAMHRTAAKAIGKARLRRELAGKLLPREVIDRALESAFQNTTEEEQIDRAINRRIRLAGIPASRAERKKLFDHLVRLGFDYELIVRRIRSLPTEPGREVVED